MPAVARVEKIVEQMPKAYQVRQVLEAINKLTETGEEGCTPNTEAQEETHGQA